MANVTNPFEEVDKGMKEATKNIKRVLKKYGIKEYPEDLLDLYDWMDDNISDAAQDEVVPYLQNLSRYTAKFYSLIRN